MTSSPEAKRPVSPSGTARDFLLVHSFLSCFLLCAIGFFIGPAQAAFGQDDSPSAPAISPATQSESKKISPELASHDEPTTFKVNVKLVVVRAVVRDSQGHAVGNLHKEDFQVFDKGKPQVITQFEVEQAGTLAAKARQKSAETSGEASSGETSSDPGQGSATPERFVAYLFDDVHLEFGDLAQVRNAAERHFSTLRPTDRAAIFTTSGRTTLDFADDRTKLREALLRLQPRPISGRVVHDCPEISYYQADQIVNKHDPDARNVAIQEASDCGPISPQNSSLGNPAALVDAIAMGVLSAGQQESRVTLGSLKQVVRAVSRMPGQRSVVLVSPGFIAPDLQSEYIEIIDRSVRSQIIISTLDARGLYVLFPYGDFIHQPAAPLGGRIPGDAEPP